VFQVTALCVVLGALLGLSLKTYKLAIRRDMPTRPFALQQAYRELKRSNDELQQQVTDYKKQCDDLTDKLASGESGRGLLAKTLDEQRLLAGTSAAHGPGIVVTLVDSPQLPKTETNPEVIKEYMVHDKDILGVVNEMFAAGAEAVAINNERWIASSSARCVGPSIMMNDRRLTPPYAIRAIGDPVGLQNAVMQKDGPADELILLDMIAIERKPDVVVPAYAGSTRHSYLKPAQETGGNG